MDFTRKPWFSCQNQLRFKLGNFSRGCPFSTPKRLRSGRVIRFTSAVSYHFSHQVDLSLRASSTWASNGIRLLACSLLPLSQKRNKQENYWSC